MRCRTLIVTSTLVLVGCTQPGVTPPPGPGSWEPTPTVTSWPTSPTNHTWAPVPGALNPAVTQATIHTTICVAGWTATVRPPVSYTNRLKREQLIKFGYADRDPRHYEEDHLMPLALGGAPRDPRNLWPEPWSTARDKDIEETALHRIVCRGELTLAEARTEILWNWGPA